MVNEEHHHKGHNHGDLKGKRLGISIALNIFITVVQVIGGFLSGSLSLLSDALHNFSDVVALVISYVADKLTKKRFTQKETFGYKRAEIIAALINATALIAIAVLIAKEAISRFNAPTEVKSLWVITLAGLSILINGGCVLLLRSDSENNMNIKSAYLHLFTDMLSSVAVLSGGVAMYYLGIFWVDSLLSMLISLYLVYSSWGLLMRTLNVLMQFAPPNLDCNEIEREIKKLPLIENIHHLHVWQLNDKETYIKMHIDLEQDLKLSQTSRVIDQVNKLLSKKFHIEHSVLQPEFGVKDSKELIVDESHAST